MKEKRLGKDLTRGTVCHKTIWGKSIIVENRLCRGPGTWSDAWGNACTYVQVANGVKKNAH